MRRMAAVLSVLMLSALGASAARAEDAESIEAIDKACSPLLGTYLTKNVAKGADGETPISRSIISLGRSGLILFADSGEGGEAGFAPFTSGSGSWRCLAGEDGTVKVRATTLDFTEPTAEHPKAEIGRLDFEFTLDPKNDALTGAATLYLVPLGSDPLDRSALRDGRQFAITTERIRAP